MIGLATKGITIASAASVGVPQIQGVGERLPFMATDSAYTEAASIAMAGAAARFMLETLVASPLLFKINENNYGTGGKASVGEFATRYFGFAAGMRALETAVYVGVLGHVLDNGLFFLARNGATPAEAIFATSIGTGILLKPARWVLYNAIVLKSNPLPIIVEKSFSALAAAAAGTKRVAYAATAYLASHM